MSKNDLHQLLWPDTFVSDGSLAVLVTEIRDALGDNARQPACVRTVQRFGYAFIAPVSDIDTRAGITGTAPSCSLTWGSQRALLRAGDNVIGRDPAAHICVDAVGISRRHALIVVTDEVTMLHDLGSKNGTFADEVRVTAPVRLQDRTQIRLGPLLIQFRRSTDMSRTPTIDLSLGLEDLR